MNLRAILVTSVLPFLLLTGCAHLKRKKPQPEIPRKTYECPRLTGPVTIDGKLDEPAWQKALKVTGFKLHYKPDTPAKTQATVYLAWDDARLYFAAEMEDKDVWADIEERDGELWTQDVVELFIKPREDKFHYYEFEFSPKGVIFDAFWPSRGSVIMSRNAKPWNVDLKAAATVQGTLVNWRDQDQGWTIETSIPLTAFEETCPAPKPGDVWTFTVSKYNFSAYLERRELSSTARKGFHEYQDYDLLRFVELAEEVEALPDSPRK